MKLTKITLLSLAVIVMLALSGHSNNKELYERLIIKAIGIDKSGSSYSVTVRVADYAENKEYNLVSSGESVFEAMSELQLAEGRTPMYSHSHFILLGRDVLDNDLRACLDFFIRYYKAHPSVQIFGAVRTASEILQYKNEDGFIPSDRMIKLSTSGEISGKAVSASLMKLVSDSEDMGSSSAIPMLELTGNGATISGSGLLCGYKLREVLTENETTGLLAAKGKLKNTVISAESDEFGLITVEVNSAEAKLDSSGDHNIWQLDVKLSMSLASSSKGARNFTDDDFREMEAVFAATAQNYIDSAISAACSSGCDVLGLGKWLYFNDTGYWRAAEENWAETMKELSFNINVTADIEELGEEDHSRRGLSG